MTTLLSSWIDRELRRQPAHLLRAAPLLMEGLEEVNPDMMPTNTRRVDVDVSDRIVDLTERDQGWALPALLTRPTLELLMASWRVRRQQHGEPRAVQVFVRFQLLFDAELVRVFPIIGPSLVYRADGERLRSLLGLPDPATLHVPITPPTISPPP